jgi:hypothetical protein
MLFSVKYNRPVQRARGIEAASMAQAHLKIIKKLAIAVQ